MIGTGIQLFFSVYGMLVFTTIFFSNYALRPYTFAISMVAIASMGWMNGFFTARVLKFFGSVDWCFSAVISAVVFPLWLLLTLGFIDVVEWAEDSSSFVPFSDAFYYIFIWLMIDLPLAFYGAFVGFRTNQAKKVCKVNPVKRKIPTQPLFMQFYIVVPVFGAVIFGTIFAEFRYIWESVWSQYMYAMFGFLLINFLLMAGVISLLAIVQIYMQLSYGNYEWWWRTFFIGASGGLYVALYAVFYLVFHMDLQLIGFDLIYLVYVYLFTVIFSIMCGSIACMSGYLFVENIYKNIKFD